jgi:hypothetical protein
VLLLLGVFEGAVLARFDGAGTFQTNVLEGVPQGSAATVAHRHVPVHFHNGDLVDELQSVASVLPELVLLGWFNVIQKPEEEGVAPTIVELSKRHHDCVGSISLKHLPTYGTTSN